MIFQSSTGQPITDDVLELLKNVSDVIRFMEGFKREYLPENPTPQQENLLHFFRIYGAALRQDMQKISPESLD